MRESLIVRSLDMFDDVEEVDAKTTVYYRPKDCEAMQVTVFLAKHGVQKHGVQHVIHVRGEGLGFYHKIDPEPADAPTTAYFPGMEDQKEDEFTYEGLVFFPFEDIVALDVDIMRKV